MEPVIKKRNLYFAAIVNILVAGLGHIYVGRPKRFVIALLIYFAFSLPFILSNVTAENPFCLYLVWIAPVVFYLFIIIDVIRIARVSKEYQLKPYNKWYIYIIYAVLLFTFNELVLRNPAYFEFLKKGFTTYTIATENMTPALQKGDIVICNKKAYENSLPQIGDIVATQIEDKNIIRRIQNINENKVFLIADNINAESPVKVPDYVPLGDITCRVSYISYSSNFERMGQRVK